MKEKVDFGTVPLKDLPGVVTKVLNACIEELKASGIKDVPEITPDKTVYDIMDVTAWDKIGSVKLAEFCYLEGLLEADAFDKDSAIWQLQVQFPLYNRDEAKTIISQWERNCVRGDFEGIPVPDLSDRNLD